jgi:DNA polymerase III subunit epsilon
MRTVYLDTETTGLNPRRDEIVEIALLDEHGEPLLDTLVRPSRMLRWPDAQAIHGISPEMVRKAPRLEELLPLLVAHLTGAHLIVYNLQYDIGFFPELVRNAPAETSCAMLAFAEHYGEIGRFGSYRWHKLDFAAAHAKHVWQGEAHRARADADAARSVWRFLQEHSETAGIEIAERMMEKSTPGLDT